MERVSFQMISRLSGYIQKFLSQVQNNGDSAVVVVSVAPCPEFKATVIGNGRLVVKDIHANKFDGAIKTGKRPARRVGEM